MEYKTKKTLILYNSIPYFLKYFKRENVQASWVLKEIPFFLKIVRKISGWLNISHIYWYSDWKKLLKSLDVVIIFAPLVEIETINLIKKTNPKIRIIYWYWNPVFRMKEVSKGKLNGVELWSFDPIDCVKYQMNFNTTFYFKEITLPKNTIEFDAIFLGTDKGRGDYLTKLENKLVKDNLKPYFRIIPDKIQKSIKKIKKMSYEEYLELVSKSKAIVDIIPEGQSGLTVRPMESIFLQKKLITTDQTIVNQDFYNKNNIFIIGRDNDYSLKEFINSPFIPIPKIILDKYDVNGWLNRFYNNE